MNSCQKVYQNTQRLRKEPCTWSDHGACPRRPSRGSGPRSQRRLPSFDGKLHRCQVDRGFGGVRVKDEYPQSHANWTSCCCPAALRLTQSKHAFEVPRKENRGVRHNVQCQKIHCMAWVPGASPFLTSSLRFDYLRVNFSSFSLLKVIKLATFRVENCRKSGPFKVSMLPAARREHQR
jgi:hypothetical protein